ncbi:shikimate dehydrogenase [Candidatus Tachikawaea gelatinosa]|uniref:Shikimate dehydrogenase (NADP(+)) n=1 Tax=Candidatus Tachikawaea gelatinosa TaxID=1410383 RepID=A0A090ART6_9ENTR|nr:shikimate dehydrogenase [Candidatus Tachikawaea gelatinosa]BAP58530.1 shikimate dehydrogenase [Candidatus Tachikawaea gelatinosa]
MNKKFAVFGNPIQHSKSPLIHKLFAIQNDIKCTYVKICPLLNKFSESIDTFFKKNNGIGANVTVPFKEEAWTIADKLSKRAKLAKSVNTLKRVDDFIIGDNTDGIGLLNDLKRLNMIYFQDNILIIGAGGATRGIILPLLKFGCSLSITNRTLSRAEKLVKSMNLENKIKVLPLNKVKNYHFNLLINATSSGIQGKVPEISEKIFYKNLRCYDLFYQNKITPFLLWCKNLGVKKYSNGLGMLVEQAAESFYFWHNIFPKTKPVIEYLKKNKNYKI